jgi:hypothetical protein
MEISGGRFLQGIGVKQSQETNIFREKITSSDFLSEAI